MSGQVIHRGFGEMRECRMGAESTFVKVALFLMTAGHTGALSAGQKRSQSPSPVPMKAVSNEEIKRLIVGKNFGCDSGYGDRMLYCEKYNRDYSYELFINSPGTSHILGSYKIINNSLVVMMGGRTWRYNILKDNAGNVFRLKFGNKTPVIIKKVGYER